MTIHSFEDPELFLLQNWPQAKSLERAVSGIERKYASLLNAALDRMQEKHRELDARVVLPDKWKFVVGFGKKAWPARYLPQWPSGFWLARIGLRHLVSNDGVVPYACIWLNPPESAGVDLKQAVERLQQASASLLPAEYSQSVQRTMKKTEADIWFPLPAFGERLRAVILENRPSDVVDCIADQFDLLTPFTPILDEILRVDTGR